jgi:metal-responsive CopG/Arc/MetJ family transcriptional regulator
MVSLVLPTDVLSQIDRLKELGGLANRSRVVEDAIKLMFEATYSLATVASRQSADTVKLSFDRLNKYAELNLAKYWVPASNARKAREGQAGQ